ncbi:MAG: hypothetical protein EI684_00160 [Candidatus Viridilinea halotolerans]|uniref:Uncharacterized protein n=1 Tax=Candidatus Viridilinea halotolerans TaxID=2491704 RepID=A0A426UCC1_9CHLR|nr:MAG: hypothetical protein EI684_00160 [Candidatus Viridilinea halotolerans]
MQHPHTRTHPATRRERRQCRERAKLNAGWIELRRRRLPPTRCRVQRKPNERLKVIRRLALTP